MEKLENILSKEEKIAMTAVVYSSTDGIEDGDYKRINRVLHQAKSNRMSFVVPKEQEA